MSDEQEMINRILTKLPSLEFSPPLPEWEIARAESLLQRQLPSVHFTDTVELSEDP
jgi:hypothetical protein